jgi:hypothetical protein
VKQYALASGLFERANAIYVDYGANNKAAWLTKMWQHFRSNEMTAVSGIFGVEVIYVGGDRPQIAILLSDCVFPSSLAPLRPAFHWRN